MGQGCCKEANEKSKPSLLQDPSDNNYDGSNSNSNNNNNKQNAINNNNLIDPSQQQHQTQTQNNQQPHHPNYNNPLSNTGSPPNNDGSIIDGTINEALLLQQQQKTQAEAERQRVLREEQARLESIVSNVGRDMVPLGGGGGGDGIGNGLGGIGNGSSMAYFDPGYAASIMQDLLNHGAFAMMDDGTSATDDATVTVNPNDASRLTDLVLGRNKIPHTCVEDGVGAVEVLSQRIDFSDCLRKGMQYDDYDVGRGGATGGGAEFLEDVAEQFLASVLCTKEGLFQDVGPIVENLP